MVTKSRAWAVAYPAYPPCKMGHWTKGEFPGDTFFFRKLVFGCQGGVGWSWVVMVVWAGTSGDGSGSLVPGLPVADENEAIRAYPG